MGAAIWQLAEPANGTVKIELLKETCIFCRFWIVRIVFISRLTLPWRHLKGLTLLALRAFWKCPQSRQRAWPRLASLMLVVFGLNARASCSFTVQSRRFRLQFFKGVHCESARDSIARFLRPFLLIASLDFVV